MKAIIKQSSFIFYYAIVLLLLVTNLCLLALLEKPIIYSLLCFYTLQLSKPLSWPRIIFGCFFISVYSFILYGRFGLDLIYLIPATLIGLQMQHTFYNSLRQYYVLLAGMLIIKLALIEPLILHMPFIIPYTILTICVNIFLMWILSLKSYN